MGKNEIRNPPFVSINSFQQAQTCCFPSLPWTFVSPIQAQSHKGLCEQACDWILANEGRWWRSTPRNSPYSSGEGHTITPVDENCPSPWAIHYSLGMSTLIVSRLITCQALCPACPYSSSPKPKKHYYFSRSEITKLREVMSPAPNPSGFILSHCAELSGKG